jgi:hypothetical protein
MKMKSTGNPPFDSSANLAGVGQRTDEIDDQ